MFRRLASTRNYSPSARVKVFLVSVMLLVVPLAVYFSLHISGRTKYYQDRHFRQLSNFSEQISRRIENLKVAFSNVVDKFVKENEGSGAEVRSYFQTSLSILKTNGTTFTAVSVDPFQKVSDSDADLGLRVTINLIQDAGITWLYFDCVDSAGKIHFVAKTNFDQLIKPLISQTTEVGLSKSEITDEFDHLVIARADNSKVLFESANDDLTLTSLDEIPLADASDKTLDLKTRSKTTTSIDITVAGGRYKLYAQPIEIAVPAKEAKEGETFLVICGLVEASRFRYQTWAISHTVLIVSVFVALLLGLSWPFLKLIFIGPKDRLRGAETYMIGIAVVIATSLLTFFFLFVWTYAHLESEMDRQLYTLATDFQQNFHNEVGNALQQIKKLDETRKDFDKATTPQSHSDDSAQESTEGLRTNILQQLCPKGKCNETDTPYPYLKSITWIDSGGRQVAKWSTGSQTTNRLVVRNREYFSKLRNGYYHELNGEKFWLEPLNSRNTGNFTVVISKETDPDPIIKASVVALDTNLMSLIKPAMVGGFCYRIINAKGDVIFPNIKENFFAESDHDNRLRSAVSGHLSDFVSVPYLGRDSRIYVTPVTSIPEWTLVVFRDKESLRSSYTEILALSAGLFVVYLLPLLLVLVILLVAWLLFGRRTKWMWPSADAAPIYIQSIAICLVLIVPGYLISARLSSSGATLMLSAITVVASLLLMASLARNWRIKRLVRFTRKLEERRSRINCRTLYSLCMIALLLLIAVLPSVTFFRLAYDEEMDLLVKYGQMTLVNNLNEREQRVHEAYPANMFEDKEAARTFTAARLDQKFDRYSRFFFDTNVENNSTGANLPTEAPATILSELRKRLPFSHSSSIVRHGLVTNGSADGLWRWSNEGNTGLSMFASQERVGSTGQLRITSIPQYFPVSLLTIIVFAVVMVGVLSLLMWFILSRVFLIGVVEARRPYAKKRTLNKLFMVLGSPFTRREERFLPLADWKVLDLKSQNGDGDWLKTFKLETFLGSELSKPIAVEDFEYQIDQPQYNLQKLSLVEQLITHNAGVVITSTAEPAAYFFEGNGQGTSGNHRPSEAAARWAKVLSHFWIDYREDNGEPRKFKREISRIRKSREEANRELYNELMNECAPRASLQEIGRNIVNRSDFDNSTIDELISEVSVQAEAYYRLIWESCTPNEKVTLSHLAEDGFLSVNDPDIQRLVRRGLIVRRRAVRLMNESFRLFVLVQRGLDKDVAVTEGQARKTSSWQYTKVALSVMVIGIMVFLFATQRDLYNSTLVALTSIAAGVPAVFNFFSLFHRNAGTPSSSSGSTS